MTNTTVWLVSIGQQITGCPFDAGKALQCARTVRKVLAQPKHSGSLPRLLHGILPTLSSMQDGPKMHPSAASHACHAGVCRGLEHAPDIGVVRWNEIWQRVKKQKRKAKKSWPTYALRHADEGFPGDRAAFGMDRNRTGTKPRPRTQRLRYAGRNRLRLKLHGAQVAMQPADKDSLQIIVSTRVSTWTSIRARRTLTVLACWRCWMGCTNSVFVCVRSASAACRSGAPEMSKDAGIVSRSL